MPKRLLKSLLLAFFLLLALPLAAFSLFGRWKTGFTFFAQTCALVPGILGDYLRAAFYKLTLHNCSLAFRISFGSFFAHPDATVGERVYIGSNCIIGKANIGKNTQIASAVQILSGGRQHARNEAGEISDSAEGVFSVVDIGANCWIGAGAIVMADVGSGSTIGAGSVVSRPIPPDSVAVGSPARVIRSTASSAPPAL